MSATTETPRSWGALLAAVIAIAVFAPSLANGFAYDDVALIANDPRVHGFDIAAIFTRGYWGDDALGLYRPFTTLSFAIDWSIGFGRPAWFHLTNTLLHAAASALLYLLLLRWFGVAAALGGAILFAIHPVHVEAVANVVGRAELLAGLGVLGALHLWSSDGVRRGRPLEVLGIAILFALGLGSKESAIVLLPLIVLIDLADGRLSPRTSLPWLRSHAFPILTLVAVLGAWLAIRTAVLGSSLAPARVDAAFDLAAAGPARVLTALQAWPVWANLLFMPVTLLADYGPRVLMPIDSWNAMAAAGAFVAFALTAAGAAAVVQDRGRAALALLWFPVTILPVSNLLFATGVIVAERTLYLPSVAASLALAFAIDYAGVRLPRPRLRLASAVLAAALLALGSRSIARIPAWRSTETMFAALVEDRPDSFRGQWALARQARNAEDTGEARHRYELALALWPFRHRLVLEAAMYAGETGDLERARALAGQAVALRPDDLDSIRYLAGVALDLRDRVAAGTIIRQGLHLDPDDETLLRMLDALSGLRTTLQ